MKLDTAIIIAAKAHAGQVDKAGQPYILHPLRVMQMVLMRYIEHDTATVAVLHDVLEDTGYTMEYLIHGVEDGLNKRQTESLHALTHQVGESRRWYIARVKANSMATSIKFCDIEDNQRRLKGLDVETRLRLSTKYYKDLEQLEAD